MNSIKNSVFQNFRLDNRLFWYDSLQNFLTSGWDWTKYWNPGDLIWLNGKLVSTRYLRTSMSNLSWAFDLISTFRNLPKGVTGGESGIFLKVPGVLGPAPASKLSIAKDLSMVLPNTFYSIFLLQAIWCNVFSLVLSK